MHDALQAFCVRSPWSMACLDALGTSVQCRECGCTVPSGMDLEEVRERWNRRPGDAIEATLGREVESDE